jgi:hypothetical protein
MPAQRRDGAYYALSRLESLKASITVTAEHMSARRIELEKHIQTDMESAREVHGALGKSRGGLAEYINESRLCLLELEEHTLAGYAGAISSQLASFNLMTRDYTALVRAVNAFSSRLPGHDTVNAAVIGRLMNTVKLGYYPTDMENIEHILRGISFPQGVVTNLLDPCCGEGKALKKLAVGNNCMTYGAELNESRAEAAQNELHRVAFGSYFHCRMSNESFHLLFLNPPYLSVTTEHGRTRDEKRFLAESYRRLMYGGLLVYIIPYYRLTSDICRILCDNFTDIEVHRFTDKVFERFKQIAVTGIRVKRADGSKQAAALSETAYSPESIPRITELSAGRYALPNISNTVQLFKGSVFNELELARQLKTSKSLNDMLSKPERETGKRRPPLPFSFAQLGLIGGSGLINGLIDCDTPHIVKGRIVKDSKTVSEGNYGKNGKLISTEITETISNRMIFNILTPEGFLLRLQ